MVRDPSKHVTSLANFGGIPTTDLSMHRGMPRHLSKTQVWLAPAVQQRLDVDELALGPVFLAKFVGPVPLDGPIWQVQRVDGVAEGDPQCLDVMTGLDDRRVSSLWQQI